MLKNQLSKINICIVLLLLVFILKGLFFVAIIPIFQGSDEYIHYATVQYLAEPKEKTWPITNKQRSETDTKNIPAFYYTQEIAGFSTLTESWNLAGAPHNTQNFAPEKIQNIENEMKSGKFLPYIDRYPPDIIPKETNLAHRIGSFIEKALAKENIFERYFSVRAFSVFYGLTIVLCAYFIALWSGMKKEHSFFIAGIVAFQPMLTATTSIINYDPLLIAAFSIFFLGAASVLAHKLRLSNVMVMIAATIIAIYTKGTGGALIILTAGMIVWGLHKRFSIFKKINAPVAIGIITIIVAIFFAFAPTQYLDIFTTISRNGKDHLSLWESLSSYFTDNLFDSGKFTRTSTTYWGTFGWLDTQLHETVIKVIQLIQFVSVLGLIILVLSRWKKSLEHFAKLKKYIPEKIQTFFKTVSEEKTFLPKKHFLIFFAIAIFLLQLVIRFYDWRGEYTSNEGIGAPGRYFLPNIIPHFMLVATGLGVFAKSSRAFGVILKTIFISMILLCLYSIFLIIIPRYYL